MRYIFIFPGLMAVFLSGVCLWTDEAPEPVSAPTGSAAGVRYFVSNEIGMALEEIGWFRKDEYPYVLEVEGRAREEIRTLFFEEEKVKRWEIGPNEERDYEKGRLKSVRRFDGSGRIEEEWQYEEDSLVSKTVFHYTNGRLGYTESFAGDGNLLFRDDYILSSKGELKEVNRTRLSGETQRLSLTIHYGRLYEEHHTNGEKEFIYRLDESGKLISEEIWQDDRLFEREQIQYSEGRPVSAEVINYNNGEKIRKYFDEEGRLLREVLEGEGTGKEETLYIRNEEGQHIKTVRKSDKGIEKWLFYYDQEGRKVQEEYFLRGILGKRTLYQPEEEIRIEELFRNKELFMRVTYRNDKKLKEEFLIEGSVIRVREYNKEE